MTHTESDTPVILARQPIFDTEEQVFGYELLFRSQESRESALIDPEHCVRATSRVLNYTFLEFGVDRVVGPKLAFVNLPRGFITSEEPLPFDPGNVVLEILEEIEVDEEVIKGVHRLKQQGYKIALDDFIFEEKFEPLLPLASIIKVDISQVDINKLNTHFMMLKPYPVILLAEKVETKEQFKSCSELGFHLYQGYFFSKPELLEDHPLPENQINLIQLIEKMQNPDVEIKEIETLILQNASLSYKLLRLLNSAAFGLRQEVTSIHQAIMLLGLRAIKAWTTLILMSEVDASHPELIEETLIRAKMAEKLASFYHIDPETGFLLGLFSTLDILFCRKMSDLLKTLPVSDEIKAALCSREGEMGHLLDTVIYYEQYQWDKIDAKYVSMEQLGQAYLIATDWMLESLKQL
jgi:EAL and modified HD-GYP domain-containing signal transduction protein